MNFLNFNINKSNDPFTKEEEEKVIIKTQQRTGKKYWTLIFGLSKEVINNKDLLKKLRLSFNCAVSKKKSKNEERYILMQGCYKQELAYFFKEVYDINASY